MYQQKLAEKEKASNLETVELRQKNLNIAVDSAQAICNTKGLCTVQATFGTKKLLIVDLKLVKSKNNGNKK